MEDEQIKEPMISWCKILVIRFHCQIGSLCGKLLNLLDSSALLNIHLKNYRTMGKQLPI